MSVEIRQKDPSWLKRLLRRYSTDSVLAVGYPQSETGGIRYPDGQSVIMIAAVQNFGSESRGVPARPFMTDAGPLAVEKTVPIAAVLMPAVNAGKATPEQVLAKMGPAAEAAFKAKITDGPWQPIKPATAAAKGSDRPLVDTGLLRGSLTHVVRKGGD